LKEKILFNFHYGIFFEKKDKTNNMKRIILSVVITYFFSTLIYAQTGRENILQGLEQGQGARENAEQQQSVTGTTKSAVRLFGTKDDLTSVIMIIPMGSQVAILDADSTYYLVNFEDNEGFVLKRQIGSITKSSGTASSDSENNNISSGKDREESVNEPYPVETQNESRFSYLERKYGTSVAARINSGKIWKGMDPDMVKDSWGNPLKINRIINGNTIREEWTYRNSILYFDDSILRNWGPVRK
jgi:hypothetical protein